MTKIKVPKKGENWEIRYGVNSINIAHVKVLEHIKNKNIKNWAEHTFICITNKGKQINVSGFCFWEKKKKNPMKKILNFLKELPKKIFFSFLYTCIDCIFFFWRIICQVFICIGKTIVKYRIWIFFIITISLMVEYHLYTIRELKEDEKNLIETFHSGQYDEYQRAKKETMYNFKD